MLVNTLKNNKNNAMDANKRKAMHIRVKNLLKNLEKNNISSAFVDTKEEALTLIKTMVPKGSYTATGGSVTLLECGITDYLKKETDYHTDPRDAYSAEFYLASANAITDRGEIYEVDGRSNRISAISFGPEKVILVVGINKLVPSLRDAVERVKNTASPANAVRLDQKTPCASLGRCVSPLFSEENILTDGCTSEECICCNALIMRRQRIKDRVTVIIVGEELGY